MYRLNIGVTPSLDVLKLAIERVEKNVLGNLKPFWDDNAGGLVGEEIGRIFATEGYGTWAPLSGRYALWKSRVYPGKTILRLKDNYFRASTMKGDAGNFYASDNDKMTWGVNLNYFRAEFGYPYPIVHESGAPSINLPQRPVFELAANSEPLRDKLEKSFMGWLQASVERELGKSL